jgi:hypothetical protein
LEANDEEGELDRVADQDEHRQAHGHADAQNGAFTILLRSGVTRHGKWKAEHDCILLREHNI